jgi:hypothetical protein
MIPRIELTCSSGFALRGSMASWRAVMRVGARGELRGSYVDGSPRSFALPRHRFAVDEALFEASRAALLELPGTPGFVMDDAPTQGITCESDAGAVARSRCEGNAERAFRERWAALYRLARPALIQAGAPPQVMGEIDALAAP